MFTVLVCGSRKWVDRHAIRDRLGKLADQHGQLRIIHGDANGADRIAARAARDLKVGCKAFPAKWREHGKRAGFLRNVEMLDQRPDLVLAFQVGHSRGTQHTIDGARHRGIPIEVHRI